MMMIFKLKLMMVMMKLMIKINVDDDNDIQTNGDDDDNGDTKTVKPRQPQILKLMERTAGNDSCPCLDLLSCGPK